MRRVYISDESRPFVYGIYNTYEAVLYINLSADPTGVILLYTKEALLA